MPGLAGEPTVPLYGLREATVVVRYILTLNPEEFPYQATAGASPQQSAL